MPQEPKKKHSKARKRTRRASINLQETVLQRCPNCNALVVPHQACKSCGFYRGKQVTEKTAVKVTKV